MEMKRLREDQPDLEMEERSVSRIKNESGQWVDAHATFVQGGQHALLPAEEVDDEHAWAHVAWDEAREAAAKAILASESGHKEIDDSKKSEFQELSGKMWDVFYSHNQQNFFKNRNYITKVWPELVGKPLAEGEQARAVVMEVGCGVGNSLFPLLELNPDKFFFVSDVSPKAIALLKTHPQYSEERINAFVCDILAQDLTPPVPAAAVDSALLIFVLSALPPAMHAPVLRKIFHALKPGGRLFLRDYGVYDMAQMRFFARKNPNKMEENFYRRGDGTFAYFFETEKLAALARTCGFEVPQCEYDTRILQNRKRMLKMYRVWVTATFQRPVEPSFPPENKL